MATRGSEGWMWAEACRLLDEAERLKREFFRPAALEREAGWEPPVDLFETEEAIWIVVALPGVEADRVRVVVEGDLLSVEGVRRLPAVLQEARIHRMEIPHGRFLRRIRLPALRLALDRRELVEGCLFLSLRKLA
jgi:HSP20 family protein